MQEESRQEKAGRGHVSRLPANILSQMIDRCGRQGEQHAEGKCGKRTERTGGTVNDRKNRPTDKRAEDDEDEKSLHDLRRHHGTFRHIGARAFTGSSSDQSPCSST